MEAAVSVAAAATTCTVPMGHRGDSHTFVLPTLTTGAYRNPLFAGTKVGDSSRPSGNCSPSKPKGSSKNSADSSWGHVTGTMVRAPASRQTGNFPWTFTLNGFGAFSMAWICSQCLSARRAAGAADCTGGERKRCGPCCLKII